MCRCAYWYVYDYACHSSIAESKELTISFHAYAVPQNNIANSADEVVDKDPKNQHEATMKVQEDKQQEVAASLNYCLGSGNKKVFVAEKEELQSRYNNFGAQLAAIIEDQEEGKALDIERICQLEEEDNQISDEIEKIKRTLSLRQEMPEESTGLLVCLCFMGPVLRQLLKVSKELTLSFMRVLQQNEFTKVALDCNATDAKPDAANDEEIARFRIGKVIRRMVKGILKRGRRIEK
jgi:hypothetical protein